MIDFIYFGGLVVEKRRGRAGPALIFCFFKNYFLISFDLTIKKLFKIEMI